MNQDDRRALKQFLLDRESEIAFGMENFGTLKSVFKEIIGRDPK